MKSTLIIERLSRQIKLLEDFKQQLLRMKVF
jgi:hypothetical protein